MADSAVQWVVDSWLTQFIDPAKRLYWGYLLAAALIAVAWAALERRRGNDDVLHALFSRRTWFSRSAWADCRVLLINSVILGVVAPRLLGSAAVAAALFTLLHEAFGGRPSLMPGLPGWTIATAFTVWLFVVDDFARYWVHRLLHTVPALWAFHKVHHSATTLNPLTVVRTHPVEGMIFAIRSALVVGFCIAVFVFAFGDRVSLVMVLGANVFKFLFNILGSNLRHSEIPLGYWRWLEKLLISPAQHQVHHSDSPEHHDRNFGVVFAVWDAMFGTLCHSERGQSLTYGLGPGCPDPHGLKSLYFTPVTESVRCLGRAAGIRQMRSRFKPDRVAKRHFPTFSDMKQKHSLLTILLATLVALPIPGAAPRAADQEIVNIYSARKEALILPLLDRFQAETGTQFRLVTGKADGLLKRIEIEGQATPADIFITVDAGRLQRAKEAGILRPVTSNVLMQRIPGHLRDEDNQWFGLSRRARVIFYARDRVDPAELSSYEDLASDKWRGRLCIRSSNNIYNQSLVASMIEHLGEQATEAWARGLVANFARKPGGGDTDQLHAVAAGQCDVTLVNTYYYGRLLNSDKEQDRQAAAKIDVFWPNQQDRGAHVNVSGAGITRHAKHPEAAQALLEFLVSPASQSWYAEVNNEYPVVDDADIPGTLDGMGEFRSDTLNLTKLGENNRAALQIMDRAGWR